MQICQDTYCKGHTRTALPGTCRSRGTGLETHQGRQQPHTGSDYCTWKATEKRVREAGGQGKELSGPSSVKKMQEPGLQHQLGSTQADGKHQHLHQFITKREEAWWHNPSPPGDISLIPASSPNKMRRLNQQWWQKTIIACFIVADMTIRLAVFS